MKNILLAVSGGLDSTCLLDYAVLNRKRLGLGRIVVCHVNHKIRGEESDGDEEFVRKLALRLGLSFFSHSLPGAEMLRNKDFENEARNARYAIFKELLVQENLDEIWTAHHADDQAETVLFRILRGSGLRGLGGIRREREDGVIRPFLCRTKKELLAYAETRGLKWREDRTNRNTAYARNFIRQALLPKIKRKNPDATEKLVHIANLASKAYARILALTDKAISPFIVSSRLWPFPAEAAPYGKIFALHEKAFIALSRKSENGASEMLRLWLREQGFDFPAGTTFRTNFANRDKTLLFEKQRKILWFCTNSKPGGGCDLYLSLARMRIPSGEWRFRRNGDEYVPFPGQTKALKKWFEDTGIPQFVRDTLPLFAEGSQIRRIYGIPPMDFERNL